MHDICQLPLQCHRETTLHKAGLAQLMILELEQYVHTSYNIIDLLQTIEIKCFLLDLIIFWICRPYLSLRQPHLYLVANLPTRVIGLTGHIRTERGDVTHWLTVEYVAELVGSLYLTTASIPYSITCFKYVDCFLPNSRNFVFSSLIKTNKQLRSAWGNASPHLSCC